MNDLDRTSLQVHSCSSSPYDWSTRSELYPEAETAQPGQRETSGRLDVRKSGVCGAGLNRNMECGVGVCTYVERDRRKEVHTVVALSNSEGQTAGGTRESKVLVHFCLFYRKLLQILPSGQFLKVIF